MCRCFNKHKKLEIYTKARHWQTKRRTKTLSTEAISAFTSEQKSHFLTYTKKKRNEFNELNFGGASVDWDSLFLEGAHGTFHIVGSLNNLDVKRNKYKGSTSTASTCHLYAQPDSEACKGILKVVQTGTSFISLVPLLWSLHCA